MPQRWGIGKQITILILLVFTASVADARPRIETGRDLVKYCELTIAALDKDPEARLRGRTAYCRSYINGYFSSLDSLQKLRQTQKVHTHDEADRIQCNRVPGTASFDQLARRLLVHAERQPELLDKPAVELLKEMFDFMDPC